MSFPKQPSFSTQSFKTAEEAVARILEIYNTNTRYLQNCFSLFGQGQNPVSPIQVCYPYIQITTHTATRIDTRLSYGFVPSPGTYRTTLTRPDLFASYYKEQLSLLLRNHNVSLEVGVSNQPIPIHFAFSEGLHLEGQLSPERVIQMRQIFDSPNLAHIDDSIVNGTYLPEEGEPLPLSLFTAPRVDYSLHRLKHYTATTPEHFQHYILFTNYQFYVDQFIEIANSLMEPTNDPAQKAYRSQYTAFVQPGNRITPNRNLNASTSTEPGVTLARMPQMPAYHLKRADGCGITLINIGVGPSNAKTITDHIAVLRPHVWIMLGHCAGLRGTQELGAYVLAHGYDRHDHVLDDALNVSVPIPALAEVQVALQDAVSKITGLKDYELKRLMRTGTVASVDNRNWELSEKRQLIQQFNQSRAIALDMESAVVAANGFRFRVPYGTLLCVSDKPLHGEIKLSGMADHFYQKQVNQHLRIGIMAMELLRELGLERLHSRKLRSFAEVAFQ